MKIHVQDGQAYSVTLLDRTRIEEGDRISLATTKVRSVIRDAELGRVRPAYLDPIEVDWADQFGTSVIALDVRKQPGFLTRYRDAKGTEYAATNLVAVWREVDPAKLHCECPLNGEPCCTCRAGADCPNPWHGTAPARAQDRWPCPECPPEDCGVSHLVAVRHAVEMALEGR